MLAGVRSFLVGSWPALGLAIMLLLLGVVPGALGERVQAPAYEEAVGVEGNLSQDGRATMLARLKTQKVDLSIGKLEFTSVVPVFSGGEHFMAFLMRWSPKLWKKLGDLTLYCVDPKGQRSRMEFFGGETKAAYKSYMVGRCDWPEELREEDCHQVVLQEVESDGTSGDATGQAGSGALAEGGPTQQLEACHSAKLAQAGPYGLVACARPPWEKPGNREASGILNMPQWVEFYRKHGVDFFLFYTTNKQDPRIDRLIKPYIEAGIAAEVRVDQDFPKSKESRSHVSRLLHELVNNDCLYRMKGRTEYLLPGQVDFDEYLRFGSGSLDGGDGGHSHVNFPRALQRLEGVSVAALLQKQEQTALLEQRSVDSSSLFSLQSSEGSANLLEKGAVHALSFGIFTFRYAGDVMQDMQLSSTMREPHTARICPKYAVKPSLCHAVFTHWPTSYVQGSRALHVPADKLVVYHYRTLDMIKTTAQDEQLAKEAADVKTLLEHSYGMPWATLAQTLEEGQDGPAHAAAASSFKAKKAKKVKKARKAMKKAKKRRRPIAVSGAEMRSEEEQAEEEDGSPLLPSEEELMADKAVSEWVSYVRTLSSPLLVSPPGVFSG